MGGDSEMTATRHDFVRLQLLRCVGLGILAAAMTGPAVLGKGHMAKPNILFIYLDDLGYGDVTLLQPRLQNPHAEY